MVKTIYIYIYIYTVNKTIYTVFKVDGPALFQSARIDGADFLNLTPPEGVTSIPLTFVGRAIYARMCCQCVSGLRHLCRDS